MAEREEVGMSGGRGKGGVEWRRKSKRCLVKGGEKEVEEMEWKMK